jgi:hypothetical protein
MTDTKDTGGLAFPSQSQLRYADEGVTLRDYFAAKAMLGIIQSHTESNEKYYQSCANTSYAMADAMMEARK